MIHITLPLGCHLMISRNSRLFYLAKKDFCLDELSNTYKLARK